MDWHPTTQLRGGTGYGWRVTTWAVVIAAIFVLPPALLSLTHADLDARTDYFSGGASPISGALTFPTSSPETGLSAFQAPERPTKEEASSPAPSNQRATFASPLSTAGPESRRRLSLLGDREIDLAFFQRAGRPALETVRPGHWIDLGRISLGDARGVWENLSTRLPAEERLACQASFDDAEAVRLRRSMPVADDHTYVCTILDSGIGRGRFQALVHVGDLVQGRDGDWQATLSSDILERWPAKTPPTLLARRYASLRALRIWGDPVKASYSFDLGARDYPIARDGVLISEHTDLFFGRHATTFEVGLRPEDRSKIMRLDGGDLTLGAYGEAWGRSVEVAEDAQYLVRLLDDDTDALILLTVNGFDEKKGEVGFTWEPLETLEALEDAGFPMIFGRVVSAQDRPFKLWHTSLFAHGLGWPKALAEVSAGPDGSFAFPVPTGEGLNVYGSDGEMACHLEVQEDATSETLMVELDAYEGGRLEVDFRSRPPMEDGPIHVRVIAPGHPGREETLSTDVHTFSGFPSGEVRVEARCGSSLGRGRAWIPRGGSETLSLEWVPTERVVARFVDRRSGAPIMDPGAIRISHHGEIWLEGPFALGACVLNALPLGPATAIEVEIPGYAASSTTSNQEAQSALIIELDALP